MRHIRAEPVCLIKWIRRHDTFSSYRLRRKLHGPFSYVAGDAASYAWRRLTRQRLVMLNGGFQEQAKKSRREISFACDAIIYEQYVILYCRSPSFSKSNRRVTEH